MIFQKPIDMVLYICLSIASIIQVIGNPPHPLVNAVESRERLLQSFLSHLDILRIYIYADTIPPRLLTDTQQGIKKLPSRFLYEIGENNYERIGSISDELERESWGYIRRLNQQMIEELPTPQAGGPQTVEHHIFGTGQVLFLTTGARCTPYNLKT